jgi:hypothetical protein
MRSHQVAIKVPVDRRLEGEVGGRKVGREMKGNDPSAQSTRLHVFMPATEPASRPVPCAIVWTALPLLTSVGLS